MKNTITRRGFTQPENTVMEQRIIPELVSGSSTPAVTQVPGKQQAWKTLKKFQGLCLFDKNREAGDPRLQASGMTLNLMSGARLTYKGGFVIPRVCSAGYSGRRGFTLIELLVVVLIIGILAAVALPQYQKAVKRSRVTQALVTLDALQKGADLYILQNGTFPSDPYKLGSIGIDITEPSDDVTINKRSNDILCYDLWPTGQMGSETPIWSAYIQRDNTRGTWTRVFCLYSHRSESAQWRQPLENAGFTESTACKYWY